LRTSHSGVCRHVYGHLFSAAWILIPSNASGLRRIAAQTVRNRLCENGFLWRCTETSASTWKGPMVQQSKGLEPAKLEASLVQRWIKIHAAEKRWPYTCLRTPEWEVRKELRPWGDVSVQRQRKPFSQRRFLTVCAAIRRRPEAFDVVSLAVTVRFLRWSTWR
jgi:hypothetical protein